MGIPGLTTFISQYEAKHSEIVYIRDCPVVVDGYNLMFTLYYSLKGSNAKHLVGGDYIGFAKSVREYFQSLKDCLITPIVILDGAYEEEKLETVEKRYQKLISENVKETIPGKVYCPVGLDNVFKDILQEQRIALFQTKLEADDTIAFIATKLNCPVLSSDSDFKIYPHLTAVPLNAVQFRRTILKSGVRGWTLSAKIVSLRKLCQTVFKFKDSKLIPLAALVLGNDRIPVTTFENFLNSKVEKYDRIEYIFKWFASQLDYDHAFKTLMESVKEVRRDAIQSLVVSIVANYMGESGEVDIWEMVQNLNIKPIQKVDLNTKTTFKRPTFKFAEVLSGHLPQGQLAAEPSVSVPPVKTSDAIARPIATVTNLPVPTDHSIQIENSAKKPENKICIPEWYLQDHYKCKLPDKLLTIVINNLIMFYPQVEAPSLPSAHDLSRPILEVTAGILLGTSSSEITIYTRNGLRVKKDLLTPKIISENQSPATSIHGANFETFEDEDAKSLIFKLFELTSAEQEFLLECPISCKFVMITIFYFLRNMPSREGPIIVIGVILSFMRETFKSNPKEHKDEMLEQEETTATLIRSQGMTSCLLNFYRVFSSLAVIPSDYKVGRVYHYSQYQCILSHGMALNNLLGNPFRPPKFQVLDSYLIYNIMDSVLNKFQGDAIGFLRKHLHSERIVPVFEKLFQITGKTFKPFIPDPMTPGNQNSKKKNRSTGNTGICALNRFSALSVD